MEVEAEVEVLPASRNRLAAGVPEVIIDLVYHFAPAGQEA